VSYLQENTPLCEFQRDEATLLAAAEAILTAAATRSTTEETTRESPVGRNMPSPQG